MGCVLVIMVILLIYWASVSPGSLFIGLAAFFIFGTIGYISNKRKREQNERKRVENEQSDRNNYEKKKREFDISNNYPTVTYKRGYAQMAQSKQFIWMEGSNLCFFPTAPLGKEDAYFIYKIPLKDIEYYSTEGSITKETKISGGGGEVGGSSISGAIVGGALAGGVGAVIGSRKKGKIEPIKSEIVTHDDRVTFVNYYVDGTKHSLFFDYSDYTTFVKMIPDKDYSNFVNTYLSRGTKSSIADELRELADLKEKGILTEEEFSEKKKILLDRIK